MSGLRTEPHTIGQNKRHLIADGSSVLAMNRLSFSPVMEGNEKENGPWFNIDDMLWFMKEKKKKERKFQYCF